MLGIHVRIINVLSFHEYKYGLDIVKEAKVNKGTVYIYLSQLEDWGYIESKEDKPGEGLFLPRRKYKLTEEGLKCKIELEKKSTSCVDGLIPEPN